MKTILYVFLLIVIINSAYPQDDSLKLMLNNIKTDLKQLIEKKEPEDIKPKIIFRQPIKDQVINKGDSILLIWDTENIEKETILNVLVSQNFGASWDTAGKVKSDDLQYWVRLKKSSKIGKIRLTDTLKNNKLTFDTEKFIVKDDNNSGNNYALISGIKSISGVKPKFEFLDVNLKLNLYNNFFLMGSADVALSGDSTNSEANKFTEGGLYVSWSPFNIPKDDLSITRKLMIGGFFKVFNTIPHVGFHIGGIETGGKFISTYIFVGVMTRLIKVNNEANTNISAPKDYMNNFYIEFAIHSQHVDILKNLRIKGGILIPAWFSKGFDGIKSQDIISRIVIEFPLGGVFSF